jgi:hypothetical protein
MLLRGYTELKEGIGYASSPITNLIRMLKISAKAFDLIRIFEKYNRIFEITKEKLNK